MSIYHFRIHCEGEEEQEFEHDSEALMTDPLEKFAKEKNLTLKDFDFYFNNSLIDYQNPTKIKDSIFGSNEGQIIIILAKSKFSHEQPEKEEKLNEDEKKEIHIENQVPKKNEIHLEYSIQQENQIQILKENQMQNQNQIENEIKEEENNEEEYFQEYEIGKKVNKKYYNDIICPKCKTSAIIDKNENELNLKILNCENFHCLNNIKYDLFDYYVFDFNDISEQNLEKITENKDLVICGICGNNKLNMTPPNDKLYICSCGYTVCSECFVCHNEPGHNKINIDDKNYFCIKHTQQFSYYCFDCNANFCERCEDLHKGHEIENFTRIKPKRGYVKELEIITKDQKEKLRDFKVSLKKVFNDIIKTIDSYLNSYIMIENTLIRRYYNSCLNYQLIRNLKNKKLFENNIFNKLEDFDKIEKPDKKIISLFNDIYKPISDAKLKSEKKRPFNNISNINNINKIKIVYNIPNKTLDRRIKLFDPVFVENNKDKLSLIVDGQKQKELSVYYYNYRDKNKIEVILEEIKYSNNKERALPVTDMSYMFYNCKYLQDVDFRNWKTDNITSMEAIFQLCDLERIPDISYFNTNNLENIRAMFCKCIKLREIPNMNKWFNNKESKISNISMLFNGCKSLTSINLPKTWYTTNLEDMSYMFNRCANLKEIHNLKILQTFKVKNMCGVFNGCEKLDNIKIDFKTPNVEDMSIMFQNCRSLEKIDIRFSDTKRLKDISGMFSGCKTIKVIKSIGIYSTDNVINMTGLFKGCFSLEAIPDLSKWNLIKVEKANGLFYGCRKLRTVPKWLPSWKFKRGTNYDKVLENCCFDNQQVIKYQWRENEPKDIIS